MTETHTLTLNYLPPSPNQQRGQHWAAKHRIRDEARWVIAAAWGQSGRPRAQHRKATLHITLHHRGPARDPDNAIASCKELIDSLVECGALVNDTPRWLPTINVACQHAAKRHTTITITYYDDPDA